MCLQRTVNSELPLEKEGDKRTNGLTVRQEGDEAFKHIMMNGNSGQPLEGWLRLL